MSEKEEDNDKGGLTRRDLLGPGAMGAGLLAYSAVASEKAAAQVGSEPLIQLGDNYEFDEDGSGNLIIRHVDNGEVFKYDETADQITDVKPFQSITTEGLTFGTPTEVHTASDLANSGSGTDADPYLGAIENAQSNLPKGSLIIADGICEPENPPITWSTAFGLHAPAYGSETGLLRLPDGANTDLLDVQTGFDIRRMFLEGNKANNSSGHIFKLTSEVTNSFFEDTSIIEAQGDNIRLEARAYAWTAKGLYVEKANGDAVRVTTASGKMEEWNWHGGYLFGNTKGLNVESSSGGGLKNHLSAVVVHNNSGNGVDIQAGSNNEFNDCAFTSNGGSGIHSTRPRDKVVGGRSESNDDHGVDLTGNLNKVIGHTATNNNQANSSSQGIQSKGFGSRVIGCSVDGGTHNLAYVIGGSRCAAYGCVDNDDEGVFTGTDSLYNGMGEESANAEEPQGNWPVGAFVDFTDSGDGSGTGVYCQLEDGTWSQFGT